MTGLFRHRSHIARKRSTRIARPITGAGAGERTPYEELWPEKEFLASLINNSFDGILAFDRECRYVVWNPGMERISGMEKSQVVGQRAFDIFPFLHETGEDDFFRAALDGKTKMARERPFIVPETGLGGFFDAYYSPIYGATGEVVGGSAIIRDVTERSRAEQALRESESKYRTLIEDASDGIAVYDTRGRLVEVNSRACEMVGYTRDEALKLNVTDVISPENLAATPLRWDALRGGQAVIGERTLLRKDGSLLPVELSARMFADGRVQAILRDITQRKAVEDEIKRLNMELERRVMSRTAQLEAANEELKKEIAERKRLEAQKDEFVSVASHELRTPITVIKGYTQIAVRAAENLGDSRLIRILRVIDQRANHLARLVEEMLDVSRIQGDKLPLELLPFDLSQLARDVVSDAELTAPNFSFTLDVPPGPLMINADRARIEQVLSNLVENAIKYQGKAGEDLRRVEISVSVTEADAIVSVRDYGLGIPADQQGQVFGRFFRANNVRSASYPYPGMGLGLYVSHNIVELHGGRMWLQSTEGEGSTFFFALPLAGSALDARNSDNA